jgi:hypothetical protein
MTDSDYHVFPTKHGINNFSRTRRTNGGINNLKLTLLMSHIDRMSNGNITFNRVGTLYSSGNKLYSEMIVNKEGMFQNLNILNEHEHMMNKIESKDIELAIRHGSTLTQSNTSYLGLLKSHLLAIANKKFPSHHFEYTAKDLLRRLNNEDLHSKLMVLEAMRESLQSNLEGDSIFTDATYQLISKASRELRLGKVGTINDLENISDWSAKLTSMYHMKNDYVQDVVTAVQQAQFRLVDKAMKDIRDLAGTTMKPGLAREVRDDAIGRLGKEKFTRFAFDQGSAMFQHLYKRRELRVLNSDGTLSNDVENVIIPELHWDINDPDTKQALSEGVISMKDIEFTNKLLDKMKERWIEYIYHTHIQDNKQYFLKENEKYTMEDAEKEFNETFKNKGDIPLVERSVSELLYSGKFKKSLEKGVGQLRMSELLFDDVATFDEDKGTDLQQMGSFFAGQKDHDSRLAAAGITILDDGTMAVKNIEKNHNLSTDVWKTFNYFNQSMIRKIEYEQNVIPVGKDAIAMLRQFGDLDSNNNLKVVKEFLERNIYRKNADKDKPFTLGKIQVNPATIARGVKGAWNRALLPLKFSLGVLSMGFNVQKIVRNSLASQLTGTSDIMPDIKYFAKAAAASMTINGAKKMRAMALNYHIWGRSETELMTDPFINITDYSVFNSLITNIFNWATDTWARSITMSAVMMQDGSWDAHEYNEKTGEVEYDETKDLRWYDENGIKKTDAATLALYEGVKNDIAKTYDLNPDDMKKLPTGYGMTDSIYMKQIADTRIIGAFSDDAQALIANRWVGSLFLQFRNYATVSAFNAGLFADNRKSDVGQRIKPVQLADGTWISKRDVVELEGSLQSLGKLVTELKETKSLSESWDTMSEVQKRNSVLSLLKLINYLILFMILRLSEEDEEDKRGGKKTASKKSNIINYYAGRFITDVFIIDAIVDMVKNPFPAIDATYEMIKNLEFWRILPYSSVISKNIN